MNLPLDKFQAALARLLQVYTYIYFASFYFVPCSLVFYWLLHMHPVGLEPRSSFSSLLVGGKEVLFELELIGKVFFISSYTCTFMSLEIITLHSTMCMGRVGLGDFLN